MNDDDKITLTFTRGEWRLIAIACARARETSFIRNGLCETKRLMKIALDICKETGRE